MEKKTLRKIAFSVIMVVMMIVVSTLFRVPEISADIDSGVISQGSLNHLRHESISADNPHPFSNEANVQRKITLKYQSASVSTNNDHMNLFMIVSSIWAFLILSVQKRFYHAAHAVEENYLGCRLIKFIRRKDGKRDRTLFQ
jgi:hypothetical protein